MKILFLVIVAALLPACASTPTDPLPAGAPASAGALPQTADHVDLQSYAGRWFVIGHLPEPGEGRQVALQLDYLVHPDGRIALQYTSREADFVHPMQLRTLEARVARSSSNAHWKLGFGAWLGLAQDYLILYVDPDYRYAVVGDGARKQAWVLARQARVTDDLYARLLSVLDAQDYDISHMLKVPQVEDQLGAPGYQ